MTVSSQMYSISHPMCSNKDNIIIVLEKLQIQIDSRSQGHISSVWFDMWGSAPAVGLPDLSACKK